MGLMDDATAALVGLAAAIAQEDRDRLLAAMDAAAGAASARACEEVLLQSYLFLGYPAALNGLGLWRKRVAPEPPAPLPEDVDLWRRRGEEVCRKVYDRQYTELREAMAKIHPELAEWAVTEGYGKVLGRPGLSLPVRELCIAAMLAGIAAPRQLFAHLRGALNVGATAQDVEAMLEIAARVLPAGRMSEARRVWDRVEERHGKHSRGEVS